MTFASTYGVTNTFLIVDSDNASTGVDCGIAFNRGSSGADALAYWDHSESKYAFDSDSSGTKAILQIAPGTTTGHAVTYEQVGKLSTTNTWTQINTFNELPTLDTYEAPTTNAQFAPKKYVDDQTASLVTGGIIQQSSPPATTNNNLWIDNTSASNYRFHRANGTIFSPITGYHIGTSAPTSPTPAAGHTWLDITNSTFPTPKYYDGSTWRQFQPTSCAGAITFASTSLHTGVATFTASAVFNGGFSVASSQTIDFNSNILTEVGTPSASTDAANKAYVDAASPKIFSCSTSVTDGNWGTSMFGTADSGSTTIAANKLAVGSVIKFYLSGIYTTDGSPSTHVFAIKLGAVTITSNSAQAFTGAATNQPFTIEGKITISAIGASGSAKATGKVSFLDGGPNTAPKEINFGTGTASGTINTTGTLAINLTDTITGSGDSGNVQMSHIELYV